MVPHRHNRGGDPIAPTRLRQLSGSIAYDGYDRIEANTNGCVVQQKPVANGGTGKDSQAAFSEKVKADRDIAEFGVEGTSAIVASLSHCHLNCVARNIEAGKRGCECLVPAVAGTLKKMKCSCKGRAILDEDGNYSMALMQGHDSDWFHDIQIGLEWEELSYTMEDEEPDAAWTISVAFNKKNDAAMKIGHLEILAALTLLCKPDPLSGVVEYEPVRDQLIDMYGPAVDHPDFVYLFALSWRLVVMRVCISRI